jgi:hypothetical protein
MSSYNKNVLAIVFLIIFGVNSFVIVVKNTCQDIFLVRDDILK